jgi:type IV fimbrial biogenesis protein FimT
LSYLCSAHSCPRARRQEKGFTLLEVLISITLMAIVAAIAMPAFRSASSTAALRRATGDLVSALNTARTQAVNLRLDVVVQEQGGDWTNGWTVNYQYPVATLAVDRVEQDQTFTQPGTVAVAEAGGATSLTFLSTGFLSGGAAQFTLCIDSHLRTIDVSALGRVTNTQGSC